MLRRYSSPLAFAIARNCSAAAAAESKEAKPNAEEGASKKPNEEASNAGSPPESNALDSTYTNQDLMSITVESYSREALTRENRQDQIEAVIWAEDTSYVPILSQGRRNVYDYTDDIPQHVRPLYPHLIEQQREFFQYYRQPSTFWSKLGKFILGAGTFTFIAGVVTFTQIWFRQPREIADMRLELLQNTYGKVLELAAGSGMNIGSYPYAVHEICMVDTNLAELQRLKYRLPKTAYPKYEIAQERAEKLASFRDGEFDCVVDMFGLCHYNDPVMALRQMQRVCKPTGCILLLEHGRTPYPPINWLLDYLSNKHTINTHGCHWNLPIRKYLKDSRMEIRELRNHHYGTTFYVVAHPERLGD